jgi:23S rRNA pseudouridine1911/1915/1917 synthase
MPIRTITLDRGDVGVRVDRVLLRHLADVPGVSRTRIQSWIEDGAVRVNGRAAPRAAWRLAAGDVVQVDLPERHRREPMRPEPGALDILYEDDHLLAVNKPAGLVVHPSYRHASGTLMNAIIAHAAGATLIHRLDKHTSGLVLAAKARAVHSAIQRAMARNEVSKEYLAIVLGKPSPARGTIDLALDRDPWDTRRVIVRDRGGVPSITKYERLAWSPPLALLCCRLVTGRMHQIRVHLAARGWPIVGDATYGPPRYPLFAHADAEGAARNFARQALHAWRMRLVHPVTRENLTLEAPLPADLRSLLSVGFRGFERITG